MNKEAAGFPYFVKTCTFEQISILRTAVSGLDELGIKALPKNAFNEGIFMILTTFKALKISGDENDERFLDSEKDTIFEIIRIGDTKKGSLGALQELCDYIEGAILKEDKEIEDIGEDEEIFKMDDVTFIWFFDILDQPRLRFGL